MSKSTATRARPLSPHLQIYRFTPTMAMSILHRITGAALYFGTLLFALWLLAAAGPREQFDFINGLFGSILGRLVLFGYTWALLHHMLGGIRHLIWDTGHGLEKDTSRRIAWGTLIGSVTLTVIVWILGYVVRGAF
ncbi:succinate dehydrogenase, cytochrome b556 subunit [Chelativorans sp. M5D2P16]|uniref:succinate dehydrogenase, cytochrome b556 subunit n=1 Tax=Chelativorans sp. M5D2P16 TaxID=3095678 RepID=UPI002ACA7D35|nr:succinate dehydrogenase, cytochrome b556 subunit [Chelativorans sp. M5D2P16]MDZ5699337.1 succinate dehydrogenase, cytochrome b556 subunit [Chelativorans sp. M5D2P16]